MSEIKCATHMYTCNTCPGDVSLTLWGCGYRYSMDWVLLAVLISTGLPMPLPTHRYEHVKHVPGLQRQNDLGEYKISEL